jgi:anti-sigma-K factor RskA
LNIQDYISSGILELYATGALSEAEQQEVEALAAKHPEIREELQSIEIAMESYALKHAVSPPAKSLDAILSKIENEAAKESKTKIIPLKPEANGSNVLRYLAYAASLLLFISVAVNIYYFNKYKTVENELADLRQDNTYLTNEFDLLKAGYQGLQSEIDIVKNPAYIAITMKGSAVSPASASVVYWDKSTGDLYVNAINLPAPSAGQQYQLWALKDGKPIDAGVFDINGTIQQMKKITEADAFAVTLEPAGGSISPTLEQLYVVGGV